MKKITGQEKDQISVQNYNENKLFYLQVESCNLHSSSNQCSSQSMGIIT